MPAPHRTTRDIAQTITNAIIARLEAGTAPWSRPWSVSGEGGRPLRHDGTPYTGINCLWLWCEADAASYRSRYWMTARQARELGGQVCSEAVASMSVYASSFVKRQGPGALPLPIAGNAGEPAARCIRFLKSYVIYNCDHIEGLPDHYYPRPLTLTPHTESAHKTRIDDFFAAIPARVRHGGDRAYFDPMRDIIQLPHVRAFRTGDCYASTRAHESCHWSGRHDRLDRTFGKKFGDKAYCVEELVAEIGSGFICADLGLPSELHDSHASYLASWLGVLRADNTAIFLAATKAEQAFAYLRGFSADAALLTANTAAA
jgi:antirestriction protein ArdC